METLRDLFITTYRDHSRAIYRHCFFRVFSEARAEELMQDVFMKFWDYIKEGKKELQNPRGLLYRMADHAIIDEKRRKTSESLDAMMEMKGFDAPSAAHINMETQALYHEAMAGLRELREEERRLFVLRYVDDLDPKEIAAIVGTTAGTISVQLNRIAAKLRNKITAFQ